MNQLLPGKCSDSQLWHACAGGMVQMPPVSSKVFYFPQGHAEHAVSTVDFPDSPRIPPSILCHVSAVTFLADTETDEVYAKIKLIPLPRNSFDIDDDVITPPVSSEKPASFSKTLTQSDANNGGGFSVPRYCAETIFPRLDYSADPPVQTVVARDVHGDTWKFRHIYRGTPRRHLLTTGWSSFVNQKKLVAGDSIVFLRTEKGDLRVGIRRAKRGFFPEPPPPWSSGSLYGGKCSMLLREEEEKLNHNGFCRKSRSSPERGKVSPETVVEAAVRAARGQPFEVVFYPRGNSPEFCVRVGLVKAAMRTQWCSGMRFKMAFETEDSSRISWFMGTVSLVHFFDLRWPDSPWRVLQVIWDEPDLVQNVKRVSPWLIELVSTVPVIHMPPLSPPKKKLRPPYPFDFPSLEGHFLLSPFSGNFLRPNGPPCFLPTTSPASIQGPRQTFGSFLSNLNNPNNKFHHSGGLFGHFRPTYNPNPNTNPNPNPNPNPGFRIPEPTAPQNPNDNEGLSCLLTIGTNPSLVRDKPRNPSKKRSQFLLFGQTILTEQQMSDKIGFPSSEETGHCKVFLESEDVGRTLDLLDLGSYEELYLRLIDMFGIERSNPLCSFLYQDAMGVFRKVGDKPFSEFARTAKRLSIMLDSGNKIVERAMLLGNLFAPAAKAGPLSTYA